MARSTVAIVGARLAGAKTAEALRARGYDGDVVLVDEERHAPYERPALSKDYIVDGPSARGSSSAPRTGTTSATGSSSPDTP